MRPLKADTTMRENVRNYERREASTLSDSKRDAQCIHDHV